MKGENFEGLNGQRSKVKGENFEGLNGQRSKVKTLKGLMVKGER